MLTLASRRSNLCKGKNFRFACQKHVHMVETFMFVIGSVNTRQKVSYRCHFKVVLCKLKFYFRVLHVILHLLTLTNLLFR